MFRLSVLVDEGIHRSSSDSGGFCVDFFPFFDRSCSFCSRP